MNSLKSIWLLNANMVASFVDEIIHSRTHLAWMAPDVRWYTVKSFLFLLRNFGRLRLCIVRSILFVFKMTCSKCVPWRLLLGLFVVVELDTPLPRGFSYVMSISPWVILLQRNYFTHENGLLNHGSMSKLISLRMASWLLRVPTPSRWR